MPNALVPNQINYLNEQLQREGAQSRADKLAESNLRLHGAQLGQQEKNALFQNAMVLENMRRQRWLDEEVTGLQAVLTNPNMTPGQRVNFIQSIAKQIGPEEANNLLNGIVAKRSNWAQAVQKGVSDYRKFMTDQNKLSGEARNLEILQGKRPTAEEYKQFKKSTKPETNVSVDVGGKSMTELGKEMSKMLVSERKDVEGAVNSLENMKEAKSLLDSGMITGTGAEFMTNVGNLLASRLGFQAAEDPVANTQAFAATMGQQVGQIIKQFGSGTGLSDADREYAEKIVGGKITLNEQAIRKLLSINEKAYKNVIKRYNKKAEQVMSQKGAESLPYDLRIDYKFDETPTEKPKETNKAPQQAIDFLRANPNLKNEFMKKYGYLPEGF